MATSLVARMAASRTLTARQSTQTSSSGSSGSNTGMIVAVVVVSAILVTVLAIGLVSCVAKKRRLQKHRRVGSTDDQEMQDSNGQGSVPGGRNAGSGGNNRNSMFSSNRLSVRSIRSIISLPAYKETPSETEEIIARAGDRAGLDYIVEGPETEEELEGHRQEEMDTIYQVQLTRRRELEERNERRAARREALARGDYREVARLDRAAAEARQRRNEAGDSQTDAPPPNSTDLIASLQQIRTRPRRVSEVAYGDLGRARHDGSRVRGQSVDNDSVPLLDSSASIAGRGSIDSHANNRSRASSVASNSAARPTTGGGGASRPTTRERSRSRASRNGGTEDRDEMTRRLSADGIPPDPPSYDDDLNVHAGQAPRYEDVVYRDPVFVGRSGSGRHASPRNSPPLSPTESSPTSHAQPTPTTSSDGGSPTEFHHHHHHQPEQQQSAAVAVSSILSPVVESTHEGETASAVPARLQTRNIMAPPAIEVQVATPTHSQPGTPTTNRFSRAER